MLFDEPHETEKRLLSCKPLWTAISFLLAIVMIPTPFAVFINPADKGPTWLGLDDSARMALNYALIKGWNWGDDIVYTYGPLAFFSTGIGFGIPAIAFILFALFLVFNFFRLFQDFILNSPHRIAASLILFLLTLTVPLYLGAGLAWVLTIFLIYWMHRYYTSPGWMPLLMLPLLCTITIYIKLNAGLFIIAFLLGFLLLLLIERKISRLHFSITIGLLLTMICGGALALNVSIPAYTKGAFEVIKGYNDLMYLYQVHPGTSGAILTLFFGLSLMFAIAAAHLIYRKQYASAFLLLCGVAYLFLLKKQSLFRNDLQHIQEFFSFAPLVLFTGVAAYIIPGRPKFFYSIAGFIVLACFVPITTDSSILFSFSERARERIKSPFRYFKAAIEYHPERYLSHKDKRILPASALQRVGNKTIDVFPWDVNYLLQNRLTYHPRPCFQTFQANSDYLQKINYEFYEKKGPEFVLYDYDAIDNAYPFNDAPTLNLFLARNYHVSDSFVSNERWRILLQRNTQIAPLASDKKGHSTLMLNDELIVNNSEFLRLNVTYSLFGKVHAFWDKPSPLLISYQRENGEWLTYKTSTELLKTGLYVGRLITTNQEFARLVSRDTSSLEKIKKIRIIGDARHYNNQIEVELF